MRKVGRPKNRTRVLGCAGWRRVLLGLMLIMGIAGGGIPVVQAATPGIQVLPVSELGPGLKGEARTVVQGTLVESIEVEILGVLDGEGPSGKLILIRVDGPVIDRVGGIASGMSGSPVYVNGQLIGAISYGFSLADPRVGMVTPIADMTEVLHLVTQAAATRASAASRGLPSKRSVPREVVLAPSQAVGTALHAQLGSKETWVMVPATTPVFVSGLGARATAVLDEALAPYSLQTVSLSTGLSPATNAGAKASAPSGWTPEPGAALGVQLARGDVTISAIGTLTLVNDGAFVAFGHPFLNRGAVNFPATAAYIHTTVRSNVSTPFKLGTPLEVVGSITQDRRAALGGLLGAAPDLLPVSVRIVDKDTGRTQQFESQVVRERSLVSALATAVALEGVDRGLDRVGEGTAQVVAVFSSSNLPNPVRRDNMVYSGFDVAAASLIEYVEGLDLLVHNEFQELTLDRVELTVEVERTRRTARVERAVLERKQVHPGEQVGITVRLRPYRGVVEERQLQLTVPADIPPGPVAVVIRGGGVTPRGGPVPDAMALGGKPDTANELPEDAVGADSTSHENLEKLVDEFINRDRFSDLVAELFPLGEYGWGEGTGREYGTPPGVPAPEKQVSAESSAVPVPDSEPRTSKPGSKPPVKVVVPMPYVIQGDTAVTLTVVPKPSAEAGEKNAADRADPEVELGPESKPAEHDGAQATEDPASGETSTDHHVLEPETADPGESKSDSE